jgi:serine/threonine-protein kinase
VLTLELLGTPSIESSDGPVAGRAAQGRQLALLALLAAARGRAVTRDKLLALLWPESPVDRARRHLSDAVYIIRSALGEDVIRSAGDELVLNAQVVTSDVARFEQLLDDGRAEEAVGLVGGPLLDGFHISGAAEFERWLDAERARLGQRHAAALESLAGASDARGDFAGAVAWWRKLAVQDPYNGRVALRLMRSLEAAGDRAGALQHARIHEVMLREEFNAAPDPDVVALAERLRLAAPARPERQPTPVPPPATAQMHRAPQADVTARPAGMQRPRRYAVLFAALLLAATLAVMYGIRWTRSPTPVPAPRSIAVLPFVNMSGDPEEDYFSDGLTEELIGVLSRVRALQVAARTSAFAFKEQHRDIRAIGAALDVGHVLEGSVRRDGNRIRVAAQLINVADGFHIWSEMYEREVTDVFAIQRDLALSIASALRAELTAAERERLGQPPTESAEAFALYLKGRHFWNQRTPVGFKRAVEYFDQAIAADSRYAAAHAGLAGVYSLMGLSGALPRAEAGERVRAAALRAIELDDNLAEAHAGLGLYLHTYEWDTEGAERELRRAVELDPSYATARYWYGNLLAALGRREEALAQKAKAVELDPLAPSLSESLAMTLLGARRIDEARQQVSNALELDSTYWRAHAVLGLVYEMMDRADDAIREYEQANELARAPVHRTRADIARVLARVGRKHEARQLIAELQAEAAATSTHEPSVATALMALGETDAALAWLEQAYQERHPLLPFIPDDSRFAAFDDHPRFIELMRRVGVKR